MMILARLGSTSSRLHRIGVVGSQFINVVLFDGHPSESVSGRSYRRGVIEGSPRWARAARIIDALFFWEREHCAHAHIADLAFARRMIEYG